MSKFIQQCEERKIPEITTREVILADSTFQYNRVILPFNCHTQSPKSYVKSLAIGGIANVRSHASFHANAGKRVGKARMYRYIELQYVQWTLSHSSTNGRIKTGHGCFRHLDTSLTMLVPSKKQLEKEKNAANAMEIDSGDDENQNDDANQSPLVHEHVMSRAFVSDIRNLNEDAGLMHATYPSDRTINRWFKKHFSASCGRNHTIINPGKSDWCDYCSKKEREMVSLKKSIQKFGTLGQLDEEQLQKIKYYNDQIQEKEQQLQLHRSICKQERDNYKAERLNQDVVYSAAANAFETLMKALDALGVGHNADQKKDLIRTFVEEHGTCKLFIDMDYQADKILQKFKVCPGPVYYLNKNIGFIFLEIIPSFGKESDAVTKFYRRRAHVREKSAGGSKTLDDTISRLLFTLTGSEIPDCKQASPIRLDPIMLEPIEEEEEEEEESSSEEEEDEEEEDTPQVITEEESSEESSEEEESSSEEEEDSCSTKERIAEVAGEFKKYTPKVKAEIRRLSEEYQRKDNLYGNSDPPRSAPPRCRTVQGFLRWLVMHPDGSPAVFKSKSMIAFLGMLAKLGSLSIIDLNFMSPGHTKFDPDILASKIGQTYISSECFNLGMLKDMAQEHSTTYSYNSVGIKLIRNTLAQTGDIVQKIQKLQKMKSFRIVSADPAFIDIVRAPENRKERHNYTKEEDYPSYMNGNTSNLSGLAAANYFITDAVLDSACHDLVKRDVTETIMAMHRKETNGGLGCATGHYGPVQNDFFKRTHSQAEVTKMRTPLLFVRADTTKIMWVEIPSFSVPFEALSKDDISQFVLSMDDTYNTSKIPKCSPKPMFGQGALNLAKCHRYLPADRLDNKYEVVDVEFNENTGDWDVTMGENIKTEHLHSFTLVALKDELTRRGIQWKQTMNRTKCIECIRQDVEDNDDGEEPDWTHRPPVTLPLPAGYLTALRKELTDDIAANAGIPGFASLTENDGYTFVTHSPTCYHAGDCKTIEGELHTTFGCFYCTYSECGTCCGLSERQIKYTGNFICTSCRENAAESAVALPM